MAFKFIAFAAFVAAANAGFAPLSYAPNEHLTYSAPLAVAAPFAKAVVAKSDHEEYDHHPQYNYAYDVHDTLTGDAKSQQESRDGDVVKGSYSLIEADGTRRIVDYTADSVHGFNAVVHKEPATVAVKSIAAAPVVHTAPVVHAAPLSYAAPIAHAYSAPIAKIATPIAHAPALAYDHAPITKYTAAPLVSHVSYSAPAVTYVH